MANNDPLKFIVAPHIVQDLGLNLYTSVPRVIVEFIANAYDADSPSAKLLLNKTEIDKQRAILKKQYELDIEKSSDKSSVKRLAERTLPGSVSISIVDQGHGMSREDLQNKFLHAGRRRRKEEGTSISRGGRVLMGRKGLGKLAGFGVAHLVEITSRIPGAKTATKITLDYEKIIAVKNTNEIPIDDEVITDSSVLPNGGTAVVLSRLLYEPMKSKLQTIENQVGDHFTMIDPSDFLVELNGTMVEPTKREHSYAWPSPELPLDQMVTKSLTTEDGIDIQFDYRLRFVADRQALIGRDRGVRVYAHKRLASTPDLLAADTNMHGFRMTDYLDGVVHADFIDDQPEDYVATDRHSLRWDSPLLSPLYEFLSLEIKEACKQRQKKRDEEKEAEVEKDLFTTSIIRDAELSKRESAVVYRIAAAVSSLHKKGFEDDGYKNQIGQVVKGMGQGEIMTTLAELAKQDNPDLDRVISQIARLTAEELDGFYRYVKSRLHGIEALSKIVDSVDFKKSNNEDQLHRLLNKCPWLIDPTYFEFLTSNQTEQSMFKQLQKVLKVGAATPSSYDNTTDDEQDPGGSNKRPDLVFMLGNKTLNSLVIVELKAPNTPLYGEHYRQLQGYVERAKKWLQQERRPEVKVEGILIGTFADVASKASDVEWLHSEIERTNNRGDYRVFSIGKMLQRTEDAHKGLLEVRGKTGS